MRSAVGATTERWLTDGAKRDAWATGLFGAGVVIAAGGRIGAGASGGDGVEPVGAAGGVEGGAAGWSLAGRAGRPRSSRMLVWSVVRLGRCSGLVARQLASIESSAGGTLATEPRGGGGWLARAVPETSPWRISARV